MRVFKRGDIVRVSLNPVVGKEQQGDMRPALVLSTDKFNKVAGVALIAPISQGANFARVAGFASSLAGTGCQTQGVVIASMIRSVDLHGRQAKLVESAPDYLVDDVLARVQAILE
jgi:mRNA interferase ChpB